MGAVFKVIKPSRLRDGAMRLAMLNGMRRIGTKMKQDFEKTVQTWKNKPKFEVLVSLSQPGPTVVVDTNDEIYRYVSEGTKPHVILPRRARALHFKGTYTAKTQPGVIEARSGGASGADVFTQGVMHPGTEPRRFQKQIADKWMRVFKQEMEEVMREAARDSGHGMRGI